MAAYSNQVKPKRKYIKKNMTEHLAGSVSALDNIYPNSPDKISGLIKEVFVLE